MVSRKQEKSRIANARSVMTAIARTPMPLYFATVAILRFTKNAMVFHLFPRANGYVENVSLLAVVFRLVSSGPALTVAAANSYITDMHLLP